MKKWMVLALSAALSVCICSCGSSPATSDGQASPQMSKVPSVSPTSKSDPESDASFSADLEQEYTEITFQGITMEVPENWEMEESESGSPSSFSIYPNPTLLAYANVMLLSIDGSDLDVDQKMDYMKSFTSSEEFDNYRFIDLTRVSIPGTDALCQEYTAQLSFGSIRGITYFIFFDNNILTLSYWVSPDLSEDFIERTTSAFDHMALSVDVSGLTGGLSNDTGSDSPPLSYAVPLGDTSVLIQNHPVSSGSGEHILNIGVGKTTTDVMASITSDELSAFISALDFDTYEYQNIVLSFEDGTGLVFMKDICVVTAEYGYVNIDPYEFEMTALLGTIWNKGDGWYYMTAAEMAAADFS